MSIVSPLALVDQVHVLAANARSKSVFKSGEDVQFSSMKFMMISFVDLSTLLISAFLVPISVLSFNQPKFCPNGITFANNSIIGLFPEALFVDKNNTIFMARDDNGPILIWRNPSVNPTTMIGASLSLPMSLFVTDDEQIFADNGITNNQVDRWASSGTRLQSVISVSSIQCSGLSVDVMGNLYCSQVSIENDRRTTKNFEWRLFAIDDGQTFFDRQRSELWEN